MKKNERKKQMNTLELLLKADTEQFKLPTRKVEIPRLSSLFNGQAVFTCQALSPTKYFDIQQTASNISSGVSNKVNVSEIQAITVLTGVIDPSFKNKDLMQHYNVPTPAELVNKILLPGEIVKLFNVITELSGFGENVIAEIKN